MAKEPKEAAKDKTEQETVRPALIVSQRVAYEYAVLLKHLFAGFAEKSIPTALVCHPDCDPGYFISPNVEVIGHPALNLPFMGHLNRRMLTERLAGFKPTILHCLCETRAAFTRKIARRLDIPYVMSVNSRKKTRGHLPVSALRCSNLIVPAKSIVADLMNSHPRFADRITHVEMGTSVKKSVGCFNNQADLVCLVTAHPFNDAAEFENLLNAVKHLVIDGYELMLILMGSGKAEDNLRKLIGALGLRWVTAIVPQLEQWRSVLAAGDIFIRPQPSNAFDPFLLEAMGMGAAVAACEGGVDDLLVGDKTCISFDPDDELSIYSSLQKLFDRRELAQQIAEGAQKHLRQNNTADKMVTDILQIYRDADQWYHHPE